MKVFKSWGSHNLIGHPLMQLFYWMGFEAAAKSIHDWTLPEHDNG